MGNLTRCFGAVLGCVRQGVSAVLIVAVLAGCETLPLRESMDKVFANHVLVQFSEAVSLHGQSMRIEPRDGGVSVSGFAGCNQYSGTGSVGGDGRLSIGPLISTRRACRDNAVSASEAAFVGALSEATFTVSVSGDVLTLTNASVKMVFDVAGG